MKRQRNFFCLLILLLSAACLRAQTTGTLRGTVKDPSGAVVPRAPVTVVQQGTNVSRSTTSNERGGFELPALPVGLYELEVTATRNWAP